MIKIFKHLKGSAVVITAIFVLLLVQALCELVLPAITSDMVNVGIQQGGIIDAVPSDIRQSELTRLMLYMTPDEAAFVKKSYSQGSPIGGEPVMQLKRVSEDERSRLNGIFGRAITAADTAAGDGTSSTSGQQLPESFITQSAVPYIRNEYSALGKNTERMQTNYLLTAGGKMAALALLAMAAGVLVTVLSARVAASLSRVLRDKIYKKVVSFSGSELDRFSIASLITRSTNDIQQIQVMMTMLFRIVIYSPLLAAGGIIMALRTNTSMAWIIAVSAGAISVLILTLFSLAMPRFKKLQVLIDRLNLVTREILTGISVIRAFCTQRHEEKRFDQANRNLMRTNLFVNRVMTFMMPSMMFIMNGIAVLIVYTGAYGVNSGAMQVGDMMAFIQYTMLIIMSFLMMSMISIMLPRASVSADRINEVIDTEPMIKDPDRPVSSPSNVRGMLEFRNVSFRYPNSDDYVLKDISFTASSGETVAFIGPTGSGKSTIVSLIPRFFDVTEGVILIDGVDIRSMSLRDLRERIGYVPQKSVLFSGTIGSNLRFGRQDAKEEEIERAAAVAQAAEFIEEKEGKYLSPIAQGGSNVSGGQKQRLSIARAVVRSPEIYLFDDSFSALDYKTDAAVRRALKKHATRSTTIVVSQRIGTILHADRILVLDKGSIVGRGTHRELLETCDVYLSIAMSQLSEEELDQNKSEEGND